MEEEANGCVDVSAKSRGSQRERDVKKRREAQGWIVTKSGRSLGAADLVCLKDGHRPELIQVKSTAAGAFSGFPPAERQELIDVAHRAGADAILCWWPYDRGGPRWLLPEDWPPL